MKGFGFNWIETGRAQNKELQSQPASLHYGRRCLGHMRLSGESPTRGPRPKPICLFRAKPVARPWATTESEEGCWGGRSPVSSLTLSHWPSWNMFHLHPEPQQLRGCNPDSSGGWVPSNSHRKEECKLESNNKQIEIHGVSTFVTCQHE